MDKQIKVYEIKKEHNIRYYKYRGRSRSPKASLTKDFIISLSGEEFYRVIAKDSTAAVHTYKKYMSNRKKSYSAYLHIGGNRPPDTPPPPPPGKKTDNNKSAVIIKTKNSKPGLMNLLVVKLSKSHALFLINKKIAIECTPDKMLESEL